MPGKIGCPKRPGTAAGGMDRALTSREQRDLGTLLATDRQIS